MQLEFDFGLFSVLFAWQDEVCVGFAAYIYVFKKKKTKRLKPEKITICRPDTVFICEFALFVNSEYFFSNVTFSCHFVTPSARFKIVNYLSCFI